MGFPSFGAGTPGRRRAAVDVQDLAGDPLAGGGDQEADGVGDVVAGPGPAKRDAGQQRREYGCPAAGCVVSIWSTTMPGATALTRMPCGASSIASTFVSMLSAAFEPQ